MRKNRLDPTVWSSPDPRIAQLEATLADTKAAWERDVRLNAELRAKQDEAIRTVQAERDAYREALTRQNDAATELLEVARLRGDNDLPHPADDPKLWTARMQTAWEEIDLATDDAADTLSHYAALATPADPQAAEEAP